jgi:hypothetical protein
MRLILAPILIELALGTTLFVSAGRLDLPWFWAVSIDRSASGFPITSERIR